MHGTWALILTPRIATTKLSLPRKNGDYRAQVPLLLKRGGHIIFQESVPTLHTLPLVVIIKLLSSHLSAENQVRDKKHIAFN